jgi:DNA repair protein RadC
VSGHDDLRSCIPRIRVSTRRVHLTLAVNDAPPPVGESITGPVQAARIARAVIGGEITECVIAIFLDARLRVSGYSEVVRGTLNASRLSARDVFVPALHANAASVCIAHNHPSGDATPSRADREVTVVLREAGRLIGVPLSDHLIVTPDAAYSFREHDGWVE